MIDKEFLRRKVMLEINRYNKEIKTLVEFRDLLEKPMPRDPSPIMVAVRECMARDVAKLDRLKTELESFWWLLEQIDKIKDGKVQK